MKKLLVTIIIILNILALTGCVATQNKSPKSLTYNSFKAFQTVYINGLNVMGDLYKQNKISEKQKNEIIKIGNDFKLSYQAASIAFETYTMNPSIQNKSQMDELIENTEFLKNEFRRYIYERQ